METNTPFHCIHGVLEGCCRVCDADHDNHTDECGTCAPLRAEITRLRGSEQKLIDLEVNLNEKLDTALSRIGELETAVLWAHDVAIYDDEYPGKNARLRRELLQKAKMVIKL